MKKVLLGIIFLLSSVTHASLLDQFKGTYQVYFNSCEKNNTDTECSVAVEKVEITVLDEKKKLVNIDLINKNKIVDSYGCGNGDTSDSSTISVSTVSQSKSKIICSWITDAAPFAPYSQRIELINESEGYFKLFIETISKHNLWHKTYNQQEQTFHLKK